MTGRIFQLVFVLIAWLSVSARVLAGCGDFANFNVVGQADFQCFASGAGKVDLFLNKANGSGGISILRILTSNAPRIRNILINNQDPRYEFRIELYGNTPAGAPASIDLIQGVGRTNVTLTLDTTGDVGTISRIRELHHSTIYGNVTGNIELQMQGEVNPGGAQIPRITGCTIMGNLEGSLVVAPFALPTAVALRGQAPVYGMVDNVMIHGRLGVPGGHSIVNVPGIVRNLRVGELNARMSGGQGDLTISGLDVNQDTGGTGDVNADIICLSLGVQVSKPNAVRIAGALNANLIIGESVTVFSSTPQIALGPLGLHGNIIIGARPPFDWAWLGEITVGGVPMKGPFYEENAASFGGGVVGLVPFALYGQECSPVHGAVLQVPPKTIRVAHYGSVAFERQVQGSIRPIVFEFRSLNGGPWLEIDRTMYRVEMTRTTRRDVRIVPGFVLPHGFEYRVRPSEDGPSPLRCDIPGPIQPLVMPYEYSFSIEHQ